MTVEPSTWWAQGSTARLAGHRIFAVDAGSGPDLTLLHGYPASSLEWAGVVGELGRHRRVLAPDLLGFGASDKPCSGPISIDAQADVVEALWAERGVERTAVVAYDYGAIVTQELLARSREGRLDVEIEAVVLSNAGLRHAAYRPRPLQRLLATPGVGDVLGRLVDRDRFHRSWGAVFGPTHPLTRATADAHFAALAHDDGLRLQRRLLGYIGERARRAERWEGVVDSWAPVAALVWGTADPVSGAHVLDAVRHALPQSRVHALEGVGHCPHLEVPGEWSDHVLAALA